ncbi:hypothetical protein C8R47DRAFT_459015 [Mycena vitilis]|nr:hypothetical protein C8R47DRAFT_459015 [Mycena vitilis]
MWLGRFSYLRGVLYETAQVNNLFSSLLRDLPTKNTLAKVFAFYIRRALDEKHLLSAIFSFPSQLPPTWAHQTGRLVGFHIAPPEDDPTHPSLKEPGDNLATECNSIQETVSWLEHVFGTVFCLPSTSNPDLIFTIELLDTTLVTVMMHASNTSVILQGSALKAVIKNLNEDNLFRDEEHDQDLAHHGRAIELLSQRSRLPTPSRMHRVLRVVASFPAKTYLKTGVRKGARGITNLNTGLFRRITEAMPTPHILDLVMENLFRDPSLSSSHATSSKRKKDGSESQTTDVRRFKSPKSDHSADASITSRRSNRTT